jgi:hypothetical protein
MTGWIVLAAGAAAGLAWLGWRRRVEVPCTLDLEATHDHFHAHAELEGVEVHEGDAVLVHDAPRHVPFGTVRTVRTRATVFQASWPRRLLVRVLGTSGITDLYEVGFEG